LQVGDARQLDEWIDAVLARHPDEARRFREGETRLLGFFMGTVMKESGGKADPKRVQPALQAKLSP
jgi:aspartyl-tRNA(Asn)/glutamyl-tRNA(Gln) amidotransferase subunit B